VLRRGRALALAGLASVVLACVSTVTGQSTPALAQRRQAIARVAVAQLGARPEEALGSAPVVSRALCDALEKRGVQVIAPDEVARAVADSAPTAGIPELAALVNKEFGADAVLLGQITRWEEREGSAAGATQPAAVGVHLELYAAPEGVRLWEGDFDHTQQPLSENVLLTPRYPGGGTRWLTAEELAEFGASELGAAVPLTP